MRDFILLVGVWLITPVATAAYLLTRRSLPRSRYLLLFDLAVLSLATVLCLGFWWREITGRIPQDIWLDEHGMLGILIPMWVSVICVPVLIVGVVMRHFLFSRVSGDATRAV